MAICFTLLSRFALAEIALPLPDPSQPLSISARQATHWEQGSYDVYVLEGACEIRQGMSTAASRDAVLWVLEESTPRGALTRVIAYLKGDVECEFVNDRGHGKLNDAAWLGEFETSAGIDLRLPTPTENPAEKPAVYDEALARRDPNRPGLKKTQMRAPPAVSPLPLIGPRPSTALPTPPEPAAVLPPGGARRIFLSPRSTVLPQVKWFPNQNQTEWIATIDSGVNLVIDGVNSVGPLDISADRAIIWTQAVDQPNLRDGTLQAQDVPLEIYLEGNIVFIEGDRRIFADQMYYNVRNQTGTVLRADLLTPVPNAAGLARVRSEVLQITGRDHFIAQNSYVTTSRFAEPRYRLQSGTIEINDTQFPAVDPATGMPAVDAEGEPVIEHRRLATSRNNVIYLSGVPVFYWPVIATDLSEPSFYLTRIAYRNDRIFGNQVLTSFDIFQLLGTRNRPTGTRWLLNIDYLSKRGWGHGTTFTYTRPGFLGIPGPASGIFDAWGIGDNGFDNLGLDRLAVPHPNFYRYRLLGRHRQILENNFQISGELGVQSDRNFLEQFYEREFDEFKDQSSDMELRRLVDNRTWYLRGETRPNHFFTDTQWLPRFDHYLMGQSLFGDRLTWYEHSSLAYAQYRLAAIPNNTVDAAKFQYLPWEGVGLTAFTRSGERLFSRNEIDLPIDVGIAKLVPYGLGELGRWGEDLAGNPLNRAYGTAGVRGSLPFWAANPQVESNLFNVHGLAHKVILETDASVSGTNSSFNALSLYDPLDDNNIEQFRRRFSYNTFNGAFPAQFDPRFYALRAGMQNWVSSPTPEIVNDFAAVRMNVNQRLQTKRGLPGQRRVIDWMVLNSGVTYFPRQNQDNFGEAMGLLNYDYRWSIGDRFTMVSDGVFDFFLQGQKIFTVGAFLTRPPRGSLYVSFRYLDGPQYVGAFTPFKSRVINASYTYQMSPKWLSAVGASVDVGGNGNIGQNISITRVGESFLMSLGVNVDSYKDNVGLTFLVEPRFLPRSSRRAAVQPVNPTVLE